MCTEEKYDEFQDSIMPKNYREFVEEKYRELLELSELKKRLEYIFPIIPHAMTSDQCQIIAEALAVPFEFILAVSEGATQENALKAAEIPQGMSQVYELCTLFSKVTGIKCYWSGKRKNLFYSVQQPSECLLLEIPDDYEPPAPLKVNWVRYDPEQHGSIELWRQRHESLRQNHKTSDEGE